MSMTLQAQIKADMKTAMKAKESQKVMALRGLMSACTNRAIAQNMGPQGILSGLFVKRLKHWVAHLILR